MADRGMGSLASSENYDDPWSRYNQPFGSIAGTAPEDTPVVFQTSSGVRITEGDIQRGMDVGMGAATVGRPTKGIKAYHSSPHDFDKFDLSKIGSGEGAQMYGHGIYAAENPAVSGQGGQYWQQFLRRFGDDEKEAAAALRHHGFNRQTALERLESDIDNIQTRIATASPNANLSGMRSALRDWQAQRDLIAGGKPVGPRTYEVNINANPNTLLDWDRPIRAQSGEVQDAVYGLVPRLRDLKPRDSPVPRIRDAQPRGESAYYILENSMRGDKGSKYGQQAASEALLERGVPGIRYLDEGSRISSSPMQIDLIRQNIAQREALLAKNPGNPTDTKWLAEYQDMLKRAENPTSNYVVFDPANIDIMRKYGVAGAPVAGGMGSLYDQTKLEGTQ